MSRITGLLILISIIYLLYVYVFVLILHFYHTLLLSLFYFLPSHNFSRSYFLSHHFFSLMYYYFFISIIFFSLPSLLLISNTILDSLYIHTLLFYHLHSISCASILTLLPPFLLLYYLPFPSHSFSLRVFSRTYLNLYFLFSIASIHLSFPPTSFCFASVDRDRVNRCRRRG